MDTLPIEYNDCWLWRGAITNSGYGAVTRNSMVWLAHRYVYSLMVDDIPKGLELDHLCKTTICVNPSHLEPVTRLENMRRRFNGTCKRGHKLQGKNLRTYNYRGTIQRRCKQCDNQAQMLRKRKYRAK